MQNYGDDLFGVVSAYGARTWWPQFSPTILAPRISGQAERFSVPDFISADRYASGDAAGKLIRTFFSTRELLTGGKFVFSGGSLFSSNRSRIMDMAERISRVDTGSGNTGRSTSVMRRCRSDPSIRAPPKPRWSPFCAASTTSRCATRLPGDRKLSKLSARCLFRARRDLAGLMPALAGVAEKPKRLMAVIGYAPCRIGDEPETTQRIDDVVIAAVSRQKEIIPAVQPEQPCAAR
ncbi:MAG: hypothetical protein WDW38_006513 [Sanguina aurantia]